MKTKSSVPNRSYVLVVGDTSCDVLIRPPRPGLSELVEPELIAGGTAGNTAMALARLGLPCQLVTELGDDFYGRRVSRLLEQAGVDMSEVRIFPGGATTQVIILLDENGSPSADWPIGDPDLYTRIRPEDVPASLVASAAWVHTSGTSAMYATARGVLLHTIALAEAAGIPLSFDINLRLHHEVNTPAGLEAIRSAASSAQVVFGSAREYQFLAGLEDAEAAARSFLTRPGQVCVLRNGPEGALGVEADRSLQSPAFQVRVRDALGAGDVFNAGFIHATLENLPLEAALRRGNAAAALKLMRAGGQRGGPTLRRLLDFLKKRVDS